MSAPVDVLAVITPNCYRNVRRAIREEAAELIADVRQAKTLLATGRINDREEAEGMLVMVWHRHNSLRARRRWLAAQRVEKNSHLSPAALARIGGAA